MNDIWWKDRLKVLEARGLPTTGVTYLPRHAYCTPFDKHIWHFRKLKQLGSNGFSTEDLKTDACYPYNDRTARLRAAHSRAIGEG